MIIDIDEFYKKAQEKINIFNEFCIDYDIESVSTVDHFGLRCSSHHIYRQVQEIFTYESNYIYESINSNRPISIISLKKPIKTKLGELKYLELSDQKKDNSQTDIFDHFEIISKSLTYIDFVETIKNRGCNLIENKKVHHSTYDIVYKGIKIKLSEEKLIEKIKKEEML